ncbi:MAG: DUF4224 domain-containing protein [Microbispora sp.]|jgi:hypothetical protein|nr:DUF4224 domain-containing protein [Microbispora sp.]
MRIACTPDELIEITGKRQGAAQIRALRAMGIEHRMRPDGTPFVLRAHVEHLLGGVQATTGRSTEPVGEWEPNFQFLRHGT